MAVKPEVVLSEACSKVCYVPAIHPEFGCRIGAETDTIIARRPLPYEAILDALEV